MLLPAPDSGGVMLQRGAEVDRTDARLAISRSLSSRAMTVTLVFAHCSFARTFTNNPWVCDIRQQDTVGPATHLVAVSRLLSMHGQHGMLRTTVEMHCRHHGASIAPLRG